MQLGLVEESVGHQPCSVVQQGLQQNGAVAAHRQIQDVLEVLRQRQMGDFGVESQPGQAIAEQSLACAPGRGK
ncbi:hypothetical protein GCM10010411_76820 [Actinomadura fulvescens]|uniref:Uncharacterized protein n=1 Tax=Actinomadura fulvescens TaxID=46160 RepID=A0ABP6CTN6_9ACTN